MATDTTLSFPSRMIPVEDVPPGVASPVLYVAESGRTYVWIMGTDGRDDPEALVAEVEGTQP